MTDGFEVLVQEVIDAIATWPLFIAKSLPFTAVGFEVSAE
jgi:hypothetical protein